MNKNVLIAAIAALLVAFVIGIGAGNFASKKTSKTEKKPVVVAKEDEPENEQGDGGDVSKAPVDEELPAKEGLAGDDLAGDDSEWKTAYLDYLNNRELDNEYGMDYSTYGTDLIYVNDDDIPELFVHGSCEAEGNQVLTYTPGKGVDELQTNRLYCYYVERANMLINSDGNSGYYHDLCYEIADGKWNMVGAGFTNEMPDEDGEWSLISCVWDDEECSRSEYDAHLEAMLKGGEKRELGIPVPWGEMKAYLSSDEPDVDYYRYAHDSKDIHRYELCKTDESAWGAAFDAEQKGGYLVRINSKEEYDVIVDQIYREGMEKCVFFIGGRRDYREPKNYRWRITDYRYDATILNQDPEMKALWMPGEPSFIGTDPEGRDVEEDEMCLMYYGKEERFVFNDVPSDLTPYYGNRVAYIIEYED